MRASRMPRTPWNPSFTNRSAMGSTKSGWLMIPPLRNPEQIPYPEPIPPPPPSQNPSDAEEEEDTPNMRELVQEIDSHVELVDLEITNNLDAVPRSVLPLTPNPATQPAVDVLIQPVVDIVQFSLMTPPLKEDKDIFIITIRTKKTSSPSPLRIVAGSVQPWPKTMNL